MEIWWLQGPYEYSQVVFKITVWDHLSFATGCVALLPETIWRRYTLWPQTDGRSWQRRSGSRCLNDVECAEKISTRNPKCWSDSGWIYVLWQSKCHGRQCVLSGHSVFPIFRCASWVSVANCIPLFLFLDVRGDERSVASWLLCGQLFSKCDGLRVRRWSLLQGFSRSNELLLPLCWHEPWVCPFSLDHWHQQDVLPRELLPTTYPPLFRPLCAGGRDGCAWKSLKISSFWNIQSGVSGAKNTRQHSKPLQSPNLPIFDARFELQQVVLECVEGIEASQPAFQSSKSPWIEINHHTPQECTKYIIKCIFIFITFCTHIKIHFTWTLYNSNEWGMEYVPSVGQLGLNGTFIKKRRRNHRAWISKM